MIQSRITAKAQTTVPQSVRRSLGARPGDTLEYVIDDGKVTLRKAEAPVLDDPFALFDEWNSEADRKAYADF